MPDISPGTVAWGTKTDVVTKQNKLGETVTAIMPVFRDSASDNKLKKANADNTATADVYGITLFGGALDDITLVVTQGEVDTGGTLVKGQKYYLSDTAGGGKICPFADLAAGSTVVELGTAITTSILDVSIDNTGVVL